VTRVSVTPDPAFDAGHAVIRVAGAAASAADPRFRLRRADYEQGVLGPGGWQVGDALLRPERAAAEGANLTLYVGPDVANHLEEAVYLFALPAAGLEESVAWPAIAPLHGGLRARMARRAVSGGGDTATDQADDTNIQGGGVQGGGTRQGGDGGAGDSSGGDQGGKDGQGGTREDDRTDEETERRRRRHRYAALGVLALLVAGGVGWFVLMPHKPPPPTPTPCCAPPPPPPPPPGPIHTEPSAGTDLSRMSPADVVAHAGSAAAIYAEGARRLRAGQNDDGVELIGEAARQGSPAALAALGRMYDPGTPQEAGLNKNPLAAARSYQAAARGGDTSVADRRAALHAELEQRAAQGDAIARQALQYWP
jgi:hypothetical protein